MSSESLISLTFDDALDQHLDNALPALNEAGLKATFYAHLSAPALSHRMTEWSALAAAGHEIGNHTIFHPADIRKSWVREGNALDHYTMDRMDMELSLASQWLAVIDGQKERTFAYPCSNSVLGSYGGVNRILFKLGLRNTRWPEIVEHLGADLGNSRQSYQSLMSQHFVASRGGGLHLSDCSPEFTDIHRYRLPSAAIEGHSFEAMQSFVTRSLERQTWVILQFHGVGGGHHLDCDLNEFHQFIRWLSEYHHEKVATVVNGARNVYAPLPETASI